MRALSKRQLFELANARRSEYEKLLKALVEIPTVSADPIHAGDIRQAADLIGSMVADFGGISHLHETGGHPLMHAIFDTDRSLPTITLYNHMDVQPASRQDEPWRTDPFKLTIKGDRYFGRGTTDDKGPALAGLLAVREARRLGMKLNFRLLWESEEETGSENFERTLRRIRKEARTDRIVVSDTGWISRKKPSITAGLRGYQGFDFVLKTGEGDQHSGGAGGAARNPLAELMQLMCEIHDAKTGRVKIPGFYDAVVPPSPGELRDFRNCGFTVEDFKKDHSLDSLRTENPLDVMKRIWALPTFEIHGVAGGYSGAGTKAIIPPEAEIKTSCRLVPNQDPDEIVRMVQSFCKRINPDVIVKRGASNPPYKGRPDPLLKSAMQFAFGIEPAFVRDGGSIGTVLSMEKILKCPVSFLGLSLPEHGYHAPNENFDWRQASGGIVAFLKYFELFSES